MKILVAKSALLVLLVAIGLFAVRQALNMVAPLKTRNLAAEVEQGARGSGKIDVVVAGTSHAIALRDLGIDLKYNLLNLSQSGLGISPMLLKVDYALSKAECRNVVLVIDDWQLASRSRSVYPRALDPYEFDFDLYKRLPDTDIGNLIYARYPLGLVGNLQSLTYERAVGFKRGVVERQQFSAETVSGGKIDPRKAAGRSGKLYNDSKLETAEEYSALIVKKCQEMQASGIRVLVVSPPLPTTFSDQAPAGAEIYKQTLARALDGGGVEFLDLSDARPEDEFYSDPDHLTSAAAREIGRSEILPLLDLD